MATVSPTPIDSPSLPLPDPADRATFGDRMREQLRWQREDAQPGFELLASQTYQNAQAAEYASVSANAAANFKGAWSALSGALTVPAAVYHNGGNWALLNNLSNVTTSEPGVSADWVEIDGVKRSGDIMTGPLSVPSGASGAQVPQAQEIAGWTQAFSKADPSSVVFAKTGAATLSIKASTSIAVGTKVVSYASATAITMPTHVAGTDYAVWVKDDGSIEATSNHSTPPAAGNWRKIGGYHYAPGGNATARAGGDTTPAINEYSLWDLKFRPACPDPRGMTLVADSFWADIYFLGVDHTVNGTSKYNVTIADGSSPPKIPLKLGGNGSSAYSNLNWWTAGEVLQSHGKSMPTYSQFAALAFGTTEATSGGTDPVSTVLRAAYTSKWGVMLSTGNLWAWGDEFGGGAGAGVWAVNTDGRGSTYQMENAVRFGGGWSQGANSGSRASDWASPTTISAPDIGARGVCDHLILV